jgi:uncharacterized protein YcbK (DUF882 family)
MRNGRPVGKTLLRRVLIGVMAVGALLGATQGTQDAVANGDTRTLEVMQMHTRERVTVTFRRNGRYDEQGLQQLNWIMRDWRRNEATKMNPRLYDLLWEVHRSAGSREPVRVVSAYRAPQTNAMLRRRSGAVADNSQHMTGNAVDFYLSDVSADRLRTIGMRMQRGGVGYYPRANTPFIHLDVASVRHWPRMTRQQLVGMFPDQRTVHVPSDGRPLAGFEQARREVLAAGGMVGGEQGNGSPQTPQRRSFWAALFGGVNEESDQDMAEADSLDSSGWINPATMGRVAPAPRQTASAPPAPAPARVAPVPVAPVAPVAVAPRAPAPVPVAPVPPAPVAASVAAPRIVPAPLPPTPPMALQSQPPAIAATPLAVPALDASREPVPLPVARPSALGIQTAAAPAEPKAEAKPAEPQLVWQQGPSGSSSGEGRVVEAAQQLAELPLPPRRPAFDAPLGTQLTAFAGTPKPVERDALAQLGIDRHGTDQLELRGNQAESYASIPTILPPRREVLASVTPTLPAAIRTSGATTTAAQQPARSSNSIAVARDARAALRSLFVDRAAPASAPAAAPSRIAVAKVRQAPSAPSGFVAAGGSGLAQGFSKETTGGLSIGSFAGPAVAPLAVSR